MGSRGDANDRTIRCVGRSGPREFSSREACWFADRIRRSARRARGRGFSLPELMVVLGVIAILFSLLVPTLRGARQEARLTRLGAEIQQIAMAVNMYCDQSREAYPLADPLNTSKSSQEYWRPLRALDLLDEAGATLAAERFGISLATMYNPEWMVYGQTRPEEPWDHPPQRIYRRQMVYPALKGLLFPQFEGIIPVGSIGPVSAWCCIPGSPSGFIAMGDGSAIRGTWEEFLPEGEMIIVDMIGMPVWTTWNGIRGRDR